MSNQSEWDSILASEGMPAELPLLTFKGEREAIRFVSLESISVDKASSLNHDCGGITIWQTSKATRYGFVQRAILGGNLTPLAAAFASELLNAPSTQGNRGEFPGYYAAAEKIGISWYVARRILIEWRHQYGTQGS